MRDIQLVLARYGVWARDNSGVSWSPIAAGFKGLLLAESSKVDTCCDDDGLIIDAAVGRLEAAQARRSDTHHAALSLWHVEKKNREDFQGE